MVEKSLVRQDDPERRKHPRFDTDLTIYFEVKYDIKTRVEYAVMGEASGGTVPARYSGVCKNVNVEGLCFASDHEVAKGDLLQLEVYEPVVRKPVMMEARVLWSKKGSPRKDGKSLFITGVQLLSVNGTPVSDSIYFDKKYKVAWSAVLDALFGTFAAMKNK